MIYISFTNWKDKFHKLKLRAFHLELVNKARIKKINYLESELIKARENDHRDSEGRYAKRPDPIIEASKKPIDYEVIKKAGK